MVSHGFSEVVSVTVPYSIKKLMGEFEIHPRQALIIGLRSPDNIIFLIDSHDATVSARVTAGFKDKLRRSHIPLRDVLIKGLMELVGKRRVILALLEHNMKLLKKYQGHVSFYESEIEMLKDLLKKENDVNKNDLHFSGGPVGNHIC